MIPAHPTSGEPASCPSADDAADSGTATATAADSVGKEAGVDKRAAALDSGEVPAPITATFGVPKGACKDSASESITKPPRLEAPATVER